MPIDNLSKITSRTGISTTILLEAGNVNATGIITASNTDFVNGNFSSSVSINDTLSVQTINLSSPGNLQVAGVSTFTGEIITTGDVGIGTTNPHKRLHVAAYGTHGAIRVEGSGNGNRSGIEFYRETSAGVSKGGAAIWVESDTSSTAGKLK